MDTRKIHVRALSTISGIMQFEHEVQNLYFLGLEDFEGKIYISLESDEYSNSGIELTNNTFIIGQPMTSFNTTYTCQLYGVVGDGEKIKLSRRFRIIIDKSNDITGESYDYPIDPNIKNAINLYIDQKEKDIDDYVGQVIDRIPSDYTSLEKASYNAYPTLPETGNPIYFDDGAEDIPVKELIVNLEPKQEGEGDPSPTNTRQISGYDGVTVKRCGKNLLQWTRDIGFVYTKNGVTFTVNSDYSVSVVGTATANADLSFARCETLPNGVLCLNGAPSAACQMRWNVTGNTGADVGNGSTATKKPSDNGNIWIRVLSGETVNAVVYPMVRFDGTDSTYEPPNYDEYSVSFPTNVGTVYGGTLNMTTGELVVDKYLLHVDESKIPDNYIHFDVLTNNARIGNLLLDTHFNAPSAMYDSSVAKTGAVSNWSVERSRGYSTDATGFYFSSNRAFYLYCEKSIFTSQDATGFKQYLASNPLYICYPLAMPVTCQLSPTEISTLLGNNTFSSDGVIDLKYRADTTKVIEKLTNAIISMGGNV